jgi:hypothetical protein
VTKNLAIATIVAITLTSALLAEEQTPLPIDEAIVSPVVEETNEEWKSEPAPPEMSSRLKKNWEESLANEDAQPEVAEYVRDWTDVEVLLSVGMLVFTATTLVMITIVIIRATKPWSPHSIVRAYGLILILSFSLLLVIAGYSKDQTAPVFGLLGVIAGYLLGSGEAQSKPKQDSR